MRRPVARRWLLRGAVLGAVLVAAAAASAQDTPPGPAAPSPVLGLELRAATPIDVAGLNVSFPQASPEGAELPFTCNEEGTVTAQPDERSFTFAEASNQGGCAEARAAIAIPTGASAFALRFEANRVIRSDADLPGQPPDMFQRVRIRDGNGTLVREIDYFSPYDTSRPDFEPFDLLVQVPAGHAAIEVGWYFYDNAPVASDRNPLATPGDAFSATVRAPTLVFEGIEFPLEAAAYRERERVVHASTEDRHGSVELVLRPDQLAANQSFLILQLPSSQILDSIVLDDGEQVAGSAFRQSTLGLQRTVELGPLGPDDWGRYSFRIHETVALPPAAAPPPPVRIEPVAWVALGFPAPLALGALVQTHRYRMGSERSQRVPVVAVATFFTIACAAYLVILGWLWMRPGFEQMAVLPVSSSGWRFYTGFGGVAIAMLGTVTVATIELRRAKDLRHSRELERSNRDLEAFAAAASHDLQEPLRDVQNSLLLLDDQYGKRVPPDGRALLREAERGAERMRDLVRGVLAFAKADVVTFRDVRLDGVVASARALVRASLSEAQARVRVDPLPQVHGDAGALVRLFENLLTNAVKFHGERAPRIHIRARRDGRLWRIEVADNGTGVPAEHRDRVFRLFERLHGHEVPGAGLGLAVCARIVERHGGTIGVEDTPGGGATFYFTLQPAKREVSR